MASTRKLTHLFHRLRHTDASFLGAAIKDKVWPARSKQERAILDAVRNRVGLEVGGPSSVFRAKKLLPIYPIVTRVDNVNFASKTAWETGLADGSEFRFQSTKAPGRQFLREATLLQGIPDSSYDFLLSSHCLEHVANPLLALREWGRVTRSGGHLVLLLPNKQWTFDHRRPTTSFAHLKADFDRGVGEDDLTHVDEILQLHDLRRDPAAGSETEFRARSLRNPENRCLHHHVFDLSLIQEALESTEWIPLHLEEVRPLHFLTLAQRR